MALSQLWQSEQWKLIEQLYPEFAKESRNLRLRLVTDGISLHNRYSDRTSWPIMFEVLNLPSNLRKQFDNVLFCGLTVGQSAVGGSDKPTVEVFRAVLRGVCDFLIDLWSEDGIPVFDADTEETCAVRGILMGTSHDGQGGQLCHARKQGGYCYCLFCLEKAACVWYPSARTGKATHKIIMADQRCHLPAGDPLRSKKSAVWSKPCKTVYTNFRKLTTHDAQVFGELVEEMERNGEDATDVIDAYGLLLSCAVLDLPYASAIKLVEWGILPVCQNDSCRHYCPVVCASGF